MAQMIDFPSIMFTVDAVRSSSASGAVYIYIAIVASYQRLPVRYEAKHRLQ